MCAIAVSDIRADLKSFEFLLVQWIHLVFKSLWKFTVISPCKVSIYFDKFWFLYAFWNYILYCNISDASWWKFTGRIRPIQLHLHRKLLHGNAQGTQRSCNYRNIIVLNESSMKNFVYYDDVIISTMAFQITSLTIVWQWYQIHIAFMIPILI